MHTIPTTYAMESLDTFTARIAEARDWAQEASLLQPPSLAILMGREVSLAADQTPIRAQGDRNSCWAFAGIAALEAAYKRRHGLELDLSEQYLFHICKAHESDFGVHSMLGGGGASDIIAHLQHLRVPTEQDAPYLSQATMRATIPGAAALETAPTNTQEQRDDVEFSPLHIPLAARAGAMYGVKKAGAIVNFTTDDIERLIRSKHEVVVNCSVGGGGHVFVIVGFNHEDQVFFVKNSWGETDLITVRYQNDPVFSIDTSVAHYIIDVIDPAIDRRSFWVGQWQMDHDGWRGRLTMRRFTDLHSSDPFSPDTSTKLGSYYLNGGKHDVTGWFEDNGQTAHLRIADIGEGGQNATLSVYSNDLTLAAGDTTWAGIPFGAQIGRSPIVPAPSNAFVASNWIGSWALNHDGWRGTLRIDAIAPLFGIAAITYTRDSGEVRPVTGIIRPGQEHVLDLTIDFGQDNPAQHFTLYHHTRETGVGSGFTTWAGRRFGAILRK